MAVETLAWQSPAGDVITFDGTDGIYVGENAPSGRFMPPVRMITEQVPLQAGERLRQVTHGVRTVDIPLVILGLNATDCRGRLRRLLAAFDPVRHDGAPGRLIASMGTGTDRELRCLYDDGAGGDESTSDPGLTQLLFVASFSGLDPYWYDTSDTTENVTASDPPAFLSDTDAFLPLNIGSSDIAVSTSVVNDGDVAIWPVWTIRGPGSNPLLTNLTTGEYLGLTIDLTTGETITVDTRPGAKTITLQDGTNLFPTRTTGSSLWRLPIGSSSVLLEFVDADSNSGLELRYRRAWLSA